MATCSVLHTGPIFGVLEQVSPKLCFLGLEPFELGADIGQAVGRMAVRRLHQSSPLG
jgi:hypothetical protein